MKGGVYPSYNKARNKTYYKVKFPGVKPKTLASKEEAETLWITWNNKDIEGTLDPRDYEADSPLQLKKLAALYLKEKQKNYEHARKGSRAFQQVNREIQRLIHAFGDTNIKTIKKKHIQDWLLSFENLSKKSLYNIIGVIRPFFKWASEREDFPCMKFPKNYNDFTLRMRNIISIEVQQVIIDEVWKIYGKSNPKIALAIEWLSRYISIRPTELLHLKEKHVGTSGYLIVDQQTSKEKEVKLIALLPEDLKKLEQFERGDPEEYFFKHPVQYGRAKAGEQFAEGFPYHAWKRACDSLGVKNVDLYGGTRHSTATAVGEFFTLAQMMEAGSMHKTNKAALRYIQTKKPESIMVYTKVSELQKAQIIDLKKTRQKILKRSTNGLQATGTLER